MRSERVRVVSYSKNYDKICEVKDFSFDIILKIFNIKSNRLSSLKG